MHGPHCTDVLVDCKEGSSPEAAHTTCKQKLQFFASVPHHSRGRAAWRWWLDFVGAGETRRGGRGRRPEGSERSGGGRGWTDLVAPDRIRHRREAARGGGGRRAASPAAAQRRVPRGSGGGVSLPAALSARSGRRGGGSRRGRHGFLLLWVKFQKRIIVHVHFSIQILNRVGHPLPSSTMPIAR